MRFLVRALLSLLILSATLYAQPPIKSQKLEFAKGASSTVVNGSIRGNAIADYVVTAVAGQKMTVSFKTSNKSAYFNGMPRGVALALFNGSVSGDDMVRRYAEEANGSLSSLCTGSARYLSRHKRPPAAIPSVVGAHDEALLGGAEHADFLHPISSPMRVRRTSAYKQLAAPLSLCKLL